MSDQVHEAASEILIGAALHNPSEHLEAIRQALSNPLVWPAEYEPIFSTICALADEHAPITAEIVAHHTGADIEKLLRWQAVARNSVTASEVDYNTQIVVARGKLEGVRLLGRDLAKANGNRTPDGYLEYALEQIGELQTIDSAKDTSKTSRLSELRVRLGKPATLAHRIGLGKLDRWTWGWMPKGITLIASAYKQRKTTVIRNIALAAAANGIPVSIATCEDSADVFDSYFIAMIANQLLLNNHIRGCNFGDDEVKLDGYYILTSRNWQKSKGQAQAVPRATDIYESLPIEVYDIGSDGIQDPDKAKSKFRRDVLTKGTKIVFVDYVGLMAWKGVQIQTRMENASIWLREVADKMGVHVVVAAQKNEEGVKGGDSSYSPNVKGGNDVPAAAHSTMTTKYDFEDKTKLQDLTVKLKLGRGVAGAQIQNYKIEENSGLITAREYRDRWEPVEVVPHDVLVGSSQPGFDDDLIDDAPRVFVAGRDDPGTREEAAR